MNGDFSGHLQVARIPTKQSWSDVSSEGARIAGPFFCVRDENAPSCEFPQYVQVTDWLALAKCRERRGCVSQFGLIGIVVRLDKGAVTFLANSSFGRPSCAQGLGDQVDFLETCTTLPSSNWLIAESGRPILSEVSAGWRGLGNSSNLPATEMS